MSYRSLKRLLGETSLERKCRFLFGGGLLLLISSSFYLYSRLYEPIFYEQNKTTARMLVAPILLEKHWKWAETDEKFKQLVTELASDFKPKDLDDYSWYLIRTGQAKLDASNRPSDDEGYKALERLKLDEKEIIQLNSKKNEEGEGETSWYNYYAPIVARKSCLDCHHHQKPSVSTGDEQLAEPDVKVGDMIGMVKISLPLEKTRKAMQLSNAILMALALVTTILAMLAAYVIVRYVIVKPVLHLKDVSDEIARGNLDLRADIRTGDEFEELSHAFNRMLRHLVTVQEELRQVNSNLDGKVDQLAQVNLQLYETNKIKDEFLATMSHELRTPLNSILGFSDVLAKGENISEKQQKYLKNIQASGQDLMSMVSDILNLAKIESGKLELKLIEFKLSDLIHRQVDAVEPLAVNKNIQLSTEIAPDLPVVYSDSGKLQQILLNLLSNAIKFTPEGGRVHVQIDVLSNEEFLLTVEDTGVGVRLEDQTIIFEKFRQGHTIPGQEDAMTREYGGTGLGLSIVKELCRILGGEIQVQSEVGKGSSFTVQMPFQYRPPQTEINHSLSQQANNSLQPTQRTLQPEAPSDEDAA